MLLLKTAPDEIKPKDPFIHGGNQGDLFVKVICPSEMLSFFPATLGGVDKSRLNSTIFQPIDAVVDHLILLNMCVPAGVSVFLLMARQP